MTEKTNPGKIPHEPGTERSGLTPVHGAAQSPDWSKQRYSAQSPDNGLIRP